uniref:Ycf1 protein n=1 Tax=Pinguicula vulgaris TaxID=204362 RepID=UPI002A819035|nr:Ycf1 protein [Pinguicula vulgaris]WOL38213.1 Ycf1 protein [Pinguicula vulgaris]
MIFQSFLLGNLVSLCMKIINSVVLVGLYYGFLTTFSIGPSYLFLLRAQVMEEGTEKKVSATTGFITGQLMIFISIYYAPLHLALGRPHTITVLALPYLLVQFFWKNHKHFFDSGSTTRNSMRNFSIQWVFLNNLIFQLFNHFILPSSMLARLVKIYMFRCNNKMLFVTSSFVGWLIGHILFMKWLGLVLVWIRQNHSIRSNVLIRSNKYLVSELRNSMARIFSILLFITCVYYLGRIPSPILTKKLKETPKREERVEKERAYEMPLLEESYLIHTNENPDNSRWKFLYKKTENKDTFFFEKFIVTLLFDSKRWNRPFRFIKNLKFERAVRNEMSQYFFGICKSDRKETISFTYPSSVSLFLEMIKSNIYWLILQKYSSKEFSTSWFYKKKKKRFMNKEKVKNFNNEFMTRIQALDKEYSPLNILERRTQLCNDDSTKEYLSRRHDPLLNGSYRRTIYKSISPSIQQKTKIGYFIENFGINKIHRILLKDVLYQEFEQKKSRFDKKVFSKNIFDLLRLRKNFVTEPESTKLNWNDRSLFLKGKLDSNYLITTIVTDSNGKKIIKKRPKIEKISKKVPQWLDKLITELEQQSREHRDNVSVDHQIRSRKAKRVVIFTDKKADTDPNTTDTKTSDQTNEVALIRYSQQSDFRRGLIKGSMRAQRRKIVIGELFQANVFSPLFLDRIKKPPLFYFDSSGLIQLIFRNSVDKGKALKIVEYTEEETKREEKNKENKRNEKLRIDISEAWDTIPFAQGIRGFMLLTQSFFRKYIKLPSLILAKNIGHILLFQLPEWSEDLEEWNREMYVKCTYNGVPLSETEFPKNWLRDGIQIKILFPFCLKPWHKSKLESSQKNIMKNKKEKDDFCFLTVWGMESEFPFGSPRKRPHFFKPIFKELEKKIGKVKKKCFQVLKVLKKKLKELSKIIRFFRLREVEVSESSEITEEKDFIINNQIIHESVSQIRSTSWTSSSMTEKKMKDFIERTSTIQNKIKRIAKNKKKVTPKKNNLSPKKTSYNLKRFEKWEILKRRNARLIGKFHFFFQFFIERIYTNIFFSMINIARIKTELFFDSTKKIIDKSIYNNQRKQEIIDKKNKNPIDTIFNKKNKNSHILYNLSYVSQAYVFYTLSQLQINNSYKLGFVSQYQGILPFFKPEKKDSFERQGMKMVLGDNKLPSYEITQWKKWLRGHYQYDLSQIRWSRLIPKKWRVHRRRVAKKEILRKWHSDQKDQLIAFKKNFEVYSLKNKKENFEKYYKYDLLAYKFLNFDYEKFCYRSPFKGKKNQDIYYNTPKETLFYMFKNSPITNFLRKVDILYIEKIADIKYFDWTILNFDLRKKAEIQAWITINTNRNKTTQIRTNNYQKVPTKNIFYLKIPEINPPNSQKGFFDWMGMNEKMLKGTVGNPEPWFFSEFVFLSNAYKTKPWFIPSKLLLLNWNRNENSSENKKINEKEKVLQSSKKKHRNKEEKKTTSRGDLESVLSQQKYIDENDTRSDIEERKKTKQYKNKTEAELALFLKRYLLFQLRWDDALTQRMISNIKVYSLLLRLMDPKKITLPSIKKREMSLDIMLIQKNLTLTELIKKGIFIIEPIRLSVKTGGQLIMSQTVSISLVHKSKHPKNQKYQEQRYGSRNNFAEVISLHQRITANRDFDLLIPENILSFRRCRKLRILIYFNSKTKNRVEINTLFWNGKKVKNSNQVSHDNNHLERDKNKKNKLIKLKLFLWPNYRLEDLACMNRYWFNTNNGSRFTMLRIHFYSRLKIRR